MTHVKSFHIVTEVFGWIVTSVSKSLANLSLARLGLVDQKSRETGLVSWSRESYFYFGILLYLLVENRSTECFREL